MTHKTMKLAKLKQKLYMKYKNVRYPAYIRAATAAATQTVSHSTYVITYKSLKSHGFKPLIRVFPLPYLYTSMLSQYFVL